jgi:hypothetical protein
LLAWSRRSRASGFDVRGSFPNLPASPGRSVSRLLPQRHQAQTDTFSTRWLAIAIPPRSGIHTSPKRERGVSIHTSPKRERGVSRASGAGRQPHSFNPRNRSSHTQAAPHIRARSASEGPAAQASKHKPEAQARDPSREAAKECSHGCKPVVRQRQKRSFKPQRGDTVASSTLVPRALPRNAVARGSCLAQPGAAIKPASIARARSPAGR